MNRSLLHLLIATVGAGTAVYSMWYIMRGPFFGRALPPLEYILVAVGGFVVGLIVFAWGSNRYAAGRGKGDRVDLEEKQQRTYK